jgi:hypothetical protein
MAKISGPGLFLLIAVSLCGNLPAQTSPDIFNQILTSKPGEGTVKINQNNNIRDLVNLHLALQKSIKGIRGYRILIYMGSGQEANKQADQARARFISRYEDIQNDKKFEYPYFKVYVGGFRTKSEALKFLKRIESEYPDAFIREDIISFPD